MAPAHLAALLLPLATPDAWQGAGTAMGILSVAAGLAAVCAAALAMPPDAAKKADLSRWRPTFSFGITPAGGMMILATFLIAAAAVTTGNNLLYLILALLLSAALISGIAARQSLRAIFVSVRVPQNVFEGEKVSLKISLTNQKRWITSFSTLVEDVALLRVRRRSAWYAGVLARPSGAPPETRHKAPVLQHAAYFPAVPPGETRSMLITQSFARRGEYRLEGIRLSTRFPFGWFRRGERIRVTGEVLVYPSIREVSSELHLLPFRPGKLEGRRLGQGESLHSIRAYREGESARLIHWKATAKTGKLMTREFTREEESEFCLILDTVNHDPGPGAPGKFEKAVSLAASLAAHFAREGADFEYLTPREYVPRGSGADHLYRILRLLAVVEIEPHGPEKSPDPVEAFSGSIQKEDLSRIFTEKVFKIIITSRPRGTLPAPVWRASRVFYYDEL
jgi:uncharacterized protein (DUF58 family)